MAAKTYLLILCAATRYEFVFYQPQKAAPAEILAIFLQMYGLYSGYCTQGGESIYKIASRLSSWTYRIRRCIWKWQDRMSEWYLCINGTIYFIHCSTASLISVRQTGSCYTLSLAWCPRRHTWTGNVPDVSHLRVFGAIVTAQIPGNYLQTFTCTLPMVYCWVLVPLQSIYATMISHHIMLNWAHTT